MAPRFAKKRNRIPANAKNNQEFFPSEQRTRGILIILLRFGRTVWCQFFLLREKSCCKVTKDRVWKFGKIYYYKQKVSLYFLIFVYGFSSLLKRDLIDDETWVWENDLFRLATMFRAILSLNPFSMRARRSTCIARCHSYAKMCSGRWN